MSGWGWLGAFLAFMGAVTAASSLVILPMFSANMRDGRPVSYLIGVAASFVLMFGAGVAVALLGCYLIGVGLR